jgi:hypothetical protein
MPLAPKNIEVRQLSHDPSVFIATIASAGHVFDKQRFWVDFKDSFCWRNCTVSPILRSVPDAKKIRVSRASLGVPQAYDFDEKTTHHLDKPHNIELDAWHTDPCKAAAAAVLAHVTDKGKELAKYKGKARRLLKKPASELVLPAQRQTTHHL